MHFDQDADEVVEGVTEVLEDLAADDVVNTTVELVLAELELVELAEVALVLIEPQLVPIRPRMHQPLEAVEAVVVVQVFPIPKMQKRLSISTGAAEATPARIRSGVANCILSQGRKGLVGR